jgi:hypothetical protein
MEAKEYINTLIKEKECLEELCKKHIETIRLMRRESIKKDKKIKKLEKEALNTNIQNEMDAIKNDLESLKNKYDDLQHMYEVVVEENYELKTILNYLNNLDGTSDSD